MYPFKGKTKYLQRVINKPYSTEIKFYTLSNHYGFIMDIFLYKGKNTTEIQVLQQNVEDRESSAVVEIIKYFLERFGYSNHFFYMDKFYGGLEVMELLQQYNQHGLLACKPNRPSNLFGQCLNNGNK